MLRFEISCEMWEQGHTCSDYSIDNACDKAREQQNAGHQPVCGTYNFALSDNLSPH